MDATIPGFLELWRAHGRPQKMILSDKDWMELSGSVRQTDIHTDGSSLSPYFVLFGCTILMSTVAPITMDLSQERVFHADV